MKYLVIICMLVSSCSIFRKSVNQHKQETNKSTFSFRDSVGRLTAETTSTSRTTGWVVSSVDSGYDMVTEELIKEIIDSSGIHRETIRTIKEKGQKRTEQKSQVLKFDSAASMITEHSQLQELEMEDSAAVVVTTQKDVKRSSFLPWWIWLIALVPLTVILVIWKKDAIVKFFT